MQDLFLLKFCWGRKPTTTYRIPIIKFCALTRLRKNKIRWHSRHLFISRWSSRRSKANKQKRWNIPVVFFSSDRLRKKEAKKRMLLLQLLLLLLLLLLTDRWAQTIIVEKWKDPSLKYFQLFFSKLFVFCKTDNIATFSLIFPCNQDLRCVTIAPYRGTTVRLHLVSIQPIIYPWSKLRSIL